MHNKDALPSKGKTRHGGVWRALSSAAECCLGAGAALSLWGTDHSPKLGYCQGILSRWATLAQSVPGELGVAPLLVAYVWYKGGAAACVAPGGQPGHAALCHALASAVAVHPHTGEVAHLPPEHAGRGRAMSCRRSHALCLRCGMVVPAGAPSAAPRARSSPPAPPGCLDWRQPGRQRPRAAP